MCIYIYTYVCVYIYIYSFRHIRKQAHPKLPGNPMYFQVYMHTGTPEVAWQSNVLRRSGMLCMYLHVPNRRCCYAMVGEDIYTVIHILYIGNVM